MNCKNSNVKMCLLLFIFVDKFCLIKERTSFFLKGENDSIVSPALGEG